MHAGRPTNVKHLVRSALVLIAGAVLCHAGEYAVLGTGFKIHAESHSVADNVVHLNTGQGVIEIPAALIAAFEQEEYTPPVPTVEVMPASVTPPIAPPVINPKQLVTKAAEEVGLPPALVHSIARAESGYALNAVSPKGAIGLMQLMPETAAALNADPRDPAQNAEAGARYLAELLLKYKDDPHQVTKAVAAYNAGPGAVDKYRGIPPYRETVNYVNRVIKQYLKDQGRP